MSGPIVDARGLHKHFGALHVLKGVDLKVAERELAAGDVCVGRSDLLDPRTDINHARQRIGMVFQSFNLYPHMTALGNVTLALRKVAGKSRSEADALGHAALARVGLAERAGHTPGQ